MHLYELRSLIVCMCGVNILSNLNHVSAERRPLFIDETNNSYCDNNNIEITKEMLQDTKEKLSKYHDSLNNFDEMNSDSDSLEQEIIAWHTTIEDSDRVHQENMFIKGSDDHDGTLRQYPYSVSIQRKGAHYATGALVGKRWVLTTAKEFYNIQETLKLFRLRFGSVDCKRRGVVMPIKDVHPHPSFVTGRPAFDVALLMTVTDVPQGAAVQPIALSKVAGRIISAKFLVTYWPRIVVKQHVLPPAAKERHKYSYMRVSTQKMLPVEKCGEMMTKANVTLTSSTLCLNPISIHHSVCMPDVGAPVVAENGLWGITSGWVSPLCPSKPGPTLVTRVTVPSVKMWIRKILKQTESI